jgi:hypothetical protein
MVVTLKKYSSKLVVSALSVVSLIALSGTARAAPPYRVAPATFSNSQLQEPPRFATAYVSILRERRPSRY